MKTNYGHTHPDEDPEIIGPSISNETKNYMQTRRGQKTDDVLFADHQKDHVGMPVHELKMWLADKPTWDHAEWLALLKDLEQKGYQNFTKTDVGQHKLGSYLEAHRPHFN